MLREHIHARCKTVSAGARAVGDLVVVERAARYADYLHLAARAAPAQACASRTTHAEVARLCRETLRVLGRTHYTTSAEDVVDID